MITDSIISEAQKEFQKTIAHLIEDYRGLQIGRASGTLVESITVQSYGVDQPLKGLANISIPDAQTIQIKPWDKSVIGNIEKAIRESSLQLNPVNDGECIRLTIPPLTEERRKQLTKIVHEMAETAHISIRNARQKAHDRMKQMHKDKEITDDESRMAEKHLQDKVDAANHEIKEHANTKEEDIMKM